jgi:hypothetical protein
MKFSAISILATIVGSTAAVDLQLFRNANGCDGFGAICRNIGPNSCCLARDRLWGSGQASGDHPAGSTTQLYTKQGDLYCGISISPRKPIPVCIVTGLESSVGGIVWFEAGRRMAQRADDSCDVQVDADDMYVDGTKTYIISKEKSALVRRDEPMPTDQTELLEYFKKHADDVIDSPVSVKAEKVDIPAAQLEASKSK